MELGREKTCRVCGRRFQWRKKWERSWEGVRHCSQACRRRGLLPTDESLEEAILGLLGARGQGCTICPSEAARAVFDGEDWRAQMEDARCAARRLVGRGLVEVTRGGRVVDASRAKGPIRLRLASGGRGGSSHLGKNSRQEP